MFGKNGVEIDITGLVKNIRDIRNFIEDYKVNYSKFSKNLKHNYARFKLLSFTIKYLLACTALSAIIFIIMLTNNVDGVYIGIALIAPWVSYFIFLMIFFPVWFLQQIYIIAKTSIVTIVNTFKRQQ